MTIQSLKKGCRIAIAVYIVLAVAFYLIGGEQFHCRDNQTDMLADSMPIGEITKGTVITQQISVEGDQLTGLTFLSATYDRVNTGVLQIEVLEDGNVVGSQQVDIATVANNGELAITFDPPINMAESTAQLRITAPQSESGNAVTLYGGNSMSTARAQVEVGLSDDELLYINDAAWTGALCVQVLSREYLWFGAYYWYIAAGGLLLLFLYCMHLIYGFKHGKRMLVVNV